MGNPKLWGTAVSKVFHRHTPDKEKPPFPLEPSADISEQTDGFYMYGQEVEEKQAKEQEEKEKKRGAAMAKHEKETSESSEGSFVSAMPVVETVHRGLAAYTIDSPDWEAPGVLTEDDTRDENGLDKVSSIMAIFSKVYSVAKIIDVGFVGFGVDLDDFPMGFVFHIKRAEEAILSNSLSQLKEVVENLYYAVYSRLVVEMANVDLCSSFTVNIRCMTAKDVFALPEPGQMYKIFLACKEILDSPSIHSHLNTATIHACQKGFFYRLASKLSTTPGFSSDSSSNSSSNDNNNNDDDDDDDDDTMSYRRHIISEISSGIPPFCNKWLRLSAVYHMPSAQVLALLSEKYLSIMPKAPITGEIPVSDLPFVNPDTIRPDVWERQIIQNHRQATLAKLEGKSIGDIRREDSESSSSAASSSSSSARLMGFAKERKCVCASTCTCAFDCTLDVERPCPCAPRMMRVLLAGRRRGPGAALAFAARCSGLAKALFDGLAVMSREVPEAEVVKELGHSLVLLEEEVRKERAAAAAAAR